MTTVQETILHLVITLLPRHQDKAGALTRRDEQSPKAASLSGRRKIHSKSIKQQIITF